MKKGSSIVFAGTTYVLLAVRMANSIAVSHGCLVRSTNSCYTREASPKRGKIIIG